MQTHGLILLATLSAFLALDAAWLGFVAIALFAAEIGPLLRPQPLLGAAAAFYLVYAVGLVRLAVQPALAAGKAGAALLNGAVLGLTAYATFDLTNLAILNGWSVRVAVLDMAWGTFASAAAALAGYLAGRRLEASAARQRT